MLMRLKHPVYELREARFAPDSWDKEARTIELTWTTGARVLRRSWSRGLYEEELSLDVEHVRMARLNKGAPLLSAHVSWDNRAVIGIVLRAWIEDGLGKALVRLSEAESVADEVFKILEGTLPNVSVGYEVYTYEITERAGELDLYRAVDWEPGELSIIPIPADMDAQVRSRNSHLSELQRPAPTVTDSQERAMGDDTKTTDLPDNVISIDAAKVQADTRAKEAVVNERQRQLDIRSSALSLNVEGDVVDKLVADGTPTAEARAQLIDEHAAANKRGIPGQDSHHVSMERDEQDTRAAAFAEALAWRSNPERSYQRSDGVTIKTGHPLTERAQEYRYSRQIDIARMCIEAAGVNTRGMANMQIAIKAFQMRGSIATTDYSALTVDTARRNLLMGYALLPAEYERLSLPRRTKDFKTNKEVIFGGQSQPKKIKEYGEFKHVTEVLGTKTWEIFTAGAMLALSLEALINDDLGAFGEQSVKAGRSFRIYENIQFWDMVISNPVTYDGDRLFTAARGNILRSGTGGDPSKAQYGLMRAVLDKQTGLESNEDLMLTMRFVVGGADQRTAMESMKVQLAPATQAAAVPGAFLGYEVISTPRIDRTNSALYYGVSDPLEPPAPAFIHAKLEGMENGPIVEQQNQWDSLSVEWRWFGFLGFSVVGHWGWVCNDQNDAITIT